MAPTKTQTSTKTSVKPLSNMDYPDGAQLILHLVHNGLPQHSIQDICIPVKKLLVTTATGTTAPTLKTDWRYLLVYRPFLNLLHGYCTEVEMDPACIDNLQSVFSTDRITSTIDATKKMILFSTPHHPDRQLSGSMLLASLVALKLPDHPELYLNVNFKGAAGRYLTDALHSSSRLFPPSSSSASAVPLPTGELSDASIQRLAQAIGNVLTSVTTASLSATPETSRQSSSEPPLTPSFRRSMGLTTPSPNHVHFLDTPLPTADNRNNSTGHGNDGGGEPPDDDDIDNADDDDDNDNNDPPVHQDPPWDIPQRTGFHYAPGRERVLAARGPMRPVVGLTWNYFCVDPNDEADLQIDPATASIRPWTAIRPDYGIITNHPVRIDVHYMDHALFLATFTQHFDSIRNKYFIAGFPIFAAENTIRDFTAWHGRLVSHCMQYGVYLPPLHTLRYDQPLGIWFPELPPWTRRDVQNVFPNMLATSLRSKTVGLLAHKDFASLLHHGDNGYRILYNLAVCAGHPLLQTYPVTWNEPTQTADLSIPEYLGAWEQYLHYCIAAGKHLSDRYFLLQVSGNLHDSLRNTLGIYLDTEVSRFEGRTSHHHALPSSFAPDQIVVKLLQHANHLRRPDLVSQSPRDRRRATLPVHSLEHAGGWTEDTPTIYNDSVNLYDIHALVGPTARKCFFCQSSAHLAPECPNLKLITANSMACRMIKNLLTPNNSPSTPNTSSTTKQVRQVDFHVAPDVSTFPDDHSPPASSSSLPSTESDFH